MANKKTTTKIIKSNDNNSNLAALIKKDMVEYIGPIFEVIKSDVQKVKTDLTKRIDSVDAKTHRLGILMEQMDTKIDTALEVSTLITQHNISIKDHDGRILDLESDVTSVKLALKSAKV